MGQTWSLPTGLVGEVTSKQALSDQSWGWEGPEGRGPGSALRASSEGRWEGVVLEVGPNGEADTGLSEVRRMVPWQVWGPRVSHSPCKN